MKISEKKFHAEQGTFDIVRSYLTLKHNLRDMFSNRASAQVLYCLFFVEDQIKQEDLFDEYLLLTYVPSNE